jgi:hypothetical protein
LIKIRCFKFSISKKLESLWFFQWIHKYQPNPKTVKLLIYLCVILVMFTWFISIPILLIIYSGALVFRYRLFQKLHHKIANQFQSSIRTKYHKFLGCMFFMMYVIFWFFILALVFTIPILFLMAIGYKIEKKREFPKIKKNVQFKFEYTEFEPNKKESKTIGYLNE